MGNIYEELFQEKLEFPKLKLYTYGTLIHDSNE